MCYIIFYFMLNPIIFAILQCILDVNKNYDTINGMNTQWLLFEKTKNLKKVKRMKNNGNFFSRDNVIMISVIWTCCVETKSSNLCAYNAVEKQLENRRGTPCMCIVYARINVFFFFLILKPYFTTVRPGELKKHPVFRPMWFSKVHRRRVLSEYTRAPRFQKRSRLLSKSRIRRDAAPKQKSYIIRTGGAFCRRRYSWQHKAVFKTRTGVLLCRVFLRARFFVFFQPPPPRLPLE